MAYEILSDKKKTQVTQLVNTADGLKLQQYYPETTAEVTNIKAIAGVTGTNDQSDDIQWLLLTMYKNEVGVLEVMVEHQGEI